MLLVEVLMPVVAFGVAWMVAVVCGLDDGVAPVQVVKARVVHPWPARETVVATTTVGAW